MKYLIAFTLIIGIQNFGLSQVSNVLPMYGPDKKTAEHKKIDDKFISTAVAEHGSRVKASEAHVDLAWRFFYNDNLETAMKRFNQAWLLNSKNPDSFYGFAALTRLNDQNKSLKYEKMGLKLDLDAKRAKVCFEHAANCLEQLKHIKETIYFLSRLIELNPSSAYYYKKRGFLFSSINKSEKALSDYNKAIELDPSDATTFNNRGFRYQQDNNFESAIIDYTKSIEIDPKYISARLNRALANWEMNKLSKALVDLNECIKLDSSHAPFYSMKGEILIELNQNEDACDSFETAIKYGDNSIESLFYKNCTRTINIEQK